MEGKKQFFVCMYHCEISMLCYRPLGDFPRLSYSYREVTFPWYSILLSADDNYATRYRSYLIVFSFRNRYCI